MDRKLEAVLEGYFLEAEEDALLESCMNDLFLTEAKLTKEEKDAKKAKDMEERKRKVKESTGLAISKIISSKLKKYNSFKLEVNPVTKKEIAKLAGKYAAIGAAAGLTGAAAGAAVGAVGSGAVATVGAKTVAKTAAKSAAVAGIGGAAIEGSIPLLAYLITKKQIKDIYSVKLYGIKDGKKDKEIGYWITTKISKSDIPSEYRKYIK